MQTIYEPSSRLMEFDPDSDCALSDQGLAEQPWLASVVGFYAVIV